MMINCNVIGSERKRLAEALGAILRWEPVYAKAPSFAYVVSNYTVDKTGRILCPDSAAPVTVEEIISTLKREGFTPEITDEAAISEEESPTAFPAETPDVAPETPEDALSAEEAEEAAGGEETPSAAEEPAGEDSPLEEIPDGTDTEEESENAEITGQDSSRLTIRIPRSKLPDDALDRLKILVKNKEELFKRALKTDSLPIVVLETDISFPWFTLTGIDGEAMAYAQFIDGLCTMAKKQTRILEKPYDGDNDKFAMRIFMVRLGMKGEKFALARKLMLKHLSGNSGWRYGAPPKKKAEPEAPEQTEPPTETDEPNTEEVPETPDDEASGNSISATEGVITGSDGDTLAETEPTEDASEAESD